MSDRKGVAAVAAIAVLLAAVGGFAVAQTLSHTATTGVTYETASGVQVTLGNDRTVDAEAASATSDTFADKNLTISGSDAQVEITDATYADTPLSVQNVDVTGSLVVKRSDLSQTLRVESGDASVIQLREVALDDGTDDIAYRSSNGVTVTFTGLPSVNVAAVDSSTGEPIGTDDASSDGEATFQLPSGSNNIALEAAPAELEVRNEIKPDELITENVSFRARLFSQGENETVVERNVTDGTVSLEGVPLDEELVVTVSEENGNYSYRRILLDSAVETNSIYLLPKDEPSAQVRFQLRDDTSRFDPDDTKLFVEKPITRNGSTTYEVISGDRFGADGEFPTVLVDNERYRLRVENSDGEQRVLGSYTVQGAEIAPLPIGEVTFEADVESGAALQANLRDAPDSVSYEQEVRLVYVDPDGRTDSIDVSIINSTGAQIRPTTTEDINGTAAYVETYPITDSSWNPEEDTATVTVTATYDDSTTEQFSKTLGDIPDALQNLPVSGQLVELIGIASIVAVIGLVLVVNPAIAALVGPGYAGLLTITGIVPLPMAGVVLSGLVGVLYAVGTNVR